MIKIQYNTKESSINSNCEKIKLANNIIINRYC